MTNRSTITATNKDILAKKKKRTNYTRFIEKQKYEHYLVLLEELDKRGFLHKSDICRYAFKRHFDTCTKATRECLRLGLIEYIEDRKVVKPTEKGLKVLEYLKELYTILDFPAMSEYIKSQKLNDSYAQAYSDLVMVRYKEEESFS